MSDFPDDVLFWDILIKLPVKSLVRFKSVSTGWGFQLSDSKFARNHLQIIKKDSNNYKDFILYEKYYDAISRMRITDNQIFFNCSTKPPILEAEELPSPLRNMETIDSITHCDGILCIHTQCSSFVVWNPLTKVEKVIKIDDKRLSDWEAFGFGYDPTIDDYKIVYVVGGNKSGRLRIRVFRLKTGLWSDAAAGQTECLLNFASYNGCTVGTRVDGCLYWITQFQDGNQVIVSFDLGKETMRYEPSLNNGNYLDNNYSILAVFKGSLCLAGMCWDDNVGEYVIEIWLMKQNDDVPEWSKLITIPCADPTQGIPRPICFVRKNDDQVLLANNFARGQLFLWNPKDESVEIVTLAGVDIPSSYDKLHVIPFTGSLVSP